jgi:DNA gyrase subunit A
VRIGDEESDIMLATRKGQSIRFASQDVRDTGRATQGVRGIKLKDDDVVVSLAVIDSSQRETTEMLAVSEQGFGKRTKLEEYPVQGRGGQGVVTLKVTSKTGNLVNLTNVIGEEELLLLSEGGVLIRTRVSEISSYGRSSQGVTVMRLGEGDRVVAAMVMLAEETLDKVIEDKEQEKQAARKDVN